MSTRSPLLLEDQLQHERMARAQSALSRGEMQVMILSDNAWIVVSKSNRYTVSLENETWGCTCPDFTGRCQQFGLRCKHIEAVRLTEPAQITRAGLESQYPYSPFLIPHTEKQMNQFMPTHDPPTPNPAVEQILRRLWQPLDMSRVKRRQAPGLGSVPFLEGYDVIETANDLFQFRWSFDLLSEPHILRWDRVVTFFDQRTRKKAPVLGEDGTPTTEACGIVYLTGKVTIELGEKAYIHADAGRCIFSGDTPEALDMAIAGAVTDCLKRCFRQLGEQFGNSLYDKEIARTAGLENNALNGNGQPEKAAAPNPPVAQTETLSYQDGIAVDSNNTAEMEAFNAFKSVHQGQFPASRESLRAWIASRNGKK